MSFKMCSQLGSSISNFAQPRLQVYRVSKLLTKKNIVESGFTLLEVMVAMAIMAIAMVAILSAQQAGINNSMRVHKGEAAAIMIRGIVMDIEEEYKQEGFPENSIEDRECEVPDEFDDMFECSYDLLRLDLTPEQIQELVNQSFGGLLGEGGLASLQSEDRGSLSPTLRSLLEGGGTSQQSIDLSGLAFLLPFLGPEGEILMDLCQINLNWLIMGLMGVQTFVPVVLQEISNRSRKLVVRLTWNEGPFGKRDLTVTTFITSLPEEELKKLKQAEEVKEMLEGAVTPQGRGAITPTKKGTRGRGQSNQIGR